MIKFHVVEETKEAYKAALYFCARLWGELWSRMAIILPDIGLILACAASVSVRFRSKGRGTRVKDRGKNFSRGQNRKSHSSVFFCSETKRKRLLRRVVFISTIYWQLNVITYLIIRLQFVFQGSNPILPLSIQSGVLFIGFLDCKTVRIFAYWSTREQSNKRSGTRLKTESETGERR